MLKTQDDFAEAAAMASHAQDELIQAAVDATSNEIFASAFGDDDPVLDETGDRTIEAMGDGLEGQIEDEEVAGEGEGEAEPKAGEDELTAAQKAAADAEAAKAQAEAAEAAKLAGKTPEPEGRVPPGRLREQTERAKAAETERDTLKAQVETERANSRKEIDELKAKFDGVLAALQRQPAPAPKPAETKPEALPDIFEDPKGFADNIQQGFKTELGTVRQVLEAQRVDTSMMIAEGRHGEAFTKAYEAVNKLNPQNPDDQMTVRRIWAAPNPGEALVTWHRNQETLREVGGDPAKFKERIATETREALMKDPEFRKQLIASLRAEAGETGTDGKPNTTFRLPPSLNGARGGPSRETVDASQGDDSQQGIFDSAWR